MFIANVLWLLGCSLIFGWTELEQELLDQGLDDYKNFVISGNKREGYLCMVFLATKQGDLDVLLKNVQSLHCDWAISFYNNDNPELQSQICNAVRWPYRAIHCRPCTLSKRDIHDMISATNKESSTNDPFALHNLIPRQAFYKDVAEAGYLLHYQYALVFDADISFAEFDFNKAMDIWNCAFPQTPLVVQPQMRGITIYTELREETWKGSGDLAVSIQDKVLEMQTPFFDTLFFDWFVRRLLSHSHRKHLLNGADWAMDWIWCGAARDYGRYVLGHADYTTYCAVLTGAGVAEHLDNKAITKTDDFMKGANNIMSFYQHSFPSWWAQKAFVVDNVQKLEVKELLAC